MPFGAGARVCLGMRFALLEQKLTLARLLRAFRLKRAPAFRVGLPFFSAE